MAIHNLASENEDLCPPSTSRFQHTELPDPKTHIRLLEVLQGSFKDPISCQLTTWPFYIAPAYYAISYAWGDPADLAQIKVNDKDMTVRKNCEYVLQQVAVTKVSRYYWLDALCIDQDGTHEKNHQVAMIGQIYKRAAHVLACIGPHADDSEYIAEYIDKHKSLLLGIWDLSAHSGKRAWWTISRYVLEIELSRRGKKRIHRLSYAMDSLLHRPYFSRLWILQELSMGSRVSWCCGNTVRFNAIPPSSR
jgi:hypothetical protein